MLKKTVLLLVSLLDLPVVLAAVLLFLPGFFSMETRVVLSGSMEPACPVGSLLFIRTADVTDVSVGDIITYQLSDDTVVTHRIYQILPDQNACLTRGDANEDPDPSPVPFDAVLGKPVFMLPYFGYFLTLLGGRAGRWLVLALVFFNLLFFFFSDREVNSRRRASHKKSIS